MTNPPLLTLGLSALAALALLAASPPSAAPGSVASGAPASDGVGPLPVEAEWGKRAEAWFAGETDMGKRRKAMRVITRALKQPCRYCHTPDWKGYTDKLGISRQMMALSVEHGVECADCHAGKDAYTEMGQTAQTMWRLAHEKKVECSHCHPKGKQFKTLTAAGEAFKAKQKK